MATRGRKLIVDNDGLNDEHVTANFKASRVPSESFCFFCLRQTRTNHLEKDGFSLPAIEIQRIFISYASFRILTFCWMITSSVVVFLLARLDPFAPPTMHCNLRCRLWQIPSAVNIYHDNFLRTGCRPSYSTMRQH